MKFPLVIIAVMLCACELFAQPGDLGYQPPAGWTYLMELDSINVYEVHSYDDTIAVMGYSERQEFYQKPVYLLSHNGGLNFDTLIMENEATVGRYRPRFVPNSNRLYRLVYAGDSLALSFSSDLGKTFSTSLEFRSGNTTNTYPPEILFSPSNNQTIFINYRSSVLQSKDGGKTWKAQGMPHNGGMNAPNSAIRLTLDARNPDIWYVLAYGDTHYDKYTSYYKTTDNGLTFRKINLLPQYSGIASEGVMRNLWVKKVPNSPDYVFPIGVFDIVDNGDTIFHDWVKTIYGVSYPNLPQGYFNSMSIYNYKFFSDNPHYAFIVGSEEEKDSIPALARRRRFDIWRTYNDGETWESIWSPMPYPLNISLDEKTKNIYVQSAYSENFYNRELPRSYALWKKQLPLSVEENLQPLKNLTGVNISPNPVENST